MEEDSPYRFDPADHEFMRLRGRLSPGARLQAMLAVREWVVGATQFKPTPAPACAHCIVYSL